MIGRAMGLAGAFMALVCLAYLIDSPFAWAGLVVATAFLARFGYREIKGELRGGADAGVAGDLPPHVRRALEGRKSNKR